MACNIDNFVYFVFDICCTSLLTWFHFIQVKVFDFKSLLVIFVTSVNSAENQNLSSNVNFI